MKDYKYILKQNNLKLSDFAKNLGVSRPTMYNMMKRYENNEPLKEPYNSIFDAYFKEDFNPITKEDLLKEKNIPSKYKCINGNILVELIENTAENSNGTFIKNSETRGKRDVVAGKIFANSNTNIKNTDILYFSFYAAQPLTLEDKLIYIVNYQDIKFIKRGD